MKNLIFTLNKAILSESDMETILTEFEAWVDSKIQRSKEKPMMETIAPLQKETDGLRVFNPLRIPMKRKTNAQ